MSILDKYKSIDIAGSVQDYKDQRDWQSKPKGTMSNEDRLKMYFRPTIPAGQKSAFINIRVLPISADSTEWFTSEWYHEVEVQDKDGKKQRVKLYDPRLNSPKRDGLSPLYNVYAELKQAFDKNGDQAAGDLAKQFKAKEFHILRIIDRANEADGPKFWRIKKKDRCAFDLIMNEIERLIRDGENCNFLHPETGFDIELTVNKAKIGNTVFDDVTATRFSKPKPLASTVEQMEEWLSDSKTVRTAFPIKPIEYLEIVASGGVPTWDKELSKYVDANAGMYLETQDDEDATVGINIVAPSVAAQKTTATVGKPAKKTKQPEPVVDEDDSEADVADDDMPF